ncbi:MAG TPA: hypothetical protein VIH99_13385 [Bdellovibrionota bacterium]|jgi:hypothetical protein
MGNLRFVALILFPFVFSACGSGLATSYGEEKERARASSLAGVIDFADGSQMNLGQQTDPVVLMFATYTCISCKEEAFKMVEFFRSKGGLPANAKIVTVLAGSGFSSAEKWKNKVCEDESTPCVTWPVGVNDDNSLFNTYCPDHLTPCVLTHNLSRAPTLIQRTGHVAIEDLEKETGPWLY